MDQELHTCRSRVFLLANYGYDKLMKLADGNIEQGKKHLTQFFVNHDQDITQEQAAYLANFTMHVLTDVGGRMVFHHAAAKGWQKVGRRGKKKSEAKKKPEDKPKQERTAEKQSTERQGKQQDAKKAKGQEKKTKGAEGGGVEQMLKNTSPQVREAYNSVKDWLGEGCKMVRNDERGIVLMSEDGLRKFRTDLLDKKYPPHVHLQEFINGEWGDAVPGLHHIYPKGNQSKITRETLFKDRG